MHRSRFALGFLLAPILFTIAVFAVGCAGAEEQPFLQKFFQAARLRDNVTLGNIATVGFDADKLGQVQGFSIASVTPEQSEPVHLKELAAAVKAAQDADAEFTKKKKDYQDANLDAIDRVLKAEQKGLKLKGKDAEIQAAWQKWRDEAGESAKKVSEARVNLGNARPVAELSVSSPQNPIDVTTLDGELITKEVTVAARVRLPTGQVVDKTLLVRMQRAMMKDANGEAINGKWIVSGIREADAGAPKTS